MWSRIVVAARVPIAALFLLSPTPDHALGQPVTGGNVVGVETTPQPRFIVKLIEFYVKDEVGIDAFGSDDVFILMNGPAYELASRKPEVNSDEWYSIPVPEQCMVPAIDPDSSPNNVWMCQESGTAAPIVFHLSAWKRELTWHWPWEGSDFSVPQTDSDILPLGDTDSMKHGNTLIGQHYVELSQATLLEKMPRVGDKWPFTISLVAGCKTPGSCFGDEPWYDFNLEVTRVGDAAGGTALNPNP